MIYVLYYPLSLIVRVLYNPSNIIKQKEESAKNFLLFFLLSFFSLSLFFRKVRRLYLNDIGANSIHESSIYRRLEQDLKP